MFSIFWNFRSVDILMPGKKSMTCQSNFLHKFEVFDRDQDGRH